ncbi:HK97 gp10 family phage protein [Lactococcus lactis]|uniref:HK97 gp10 family phage protein n=1 Tax=Lactococcus lactis TaxID=1358 RepID=A0A6B3S325_9LACT|nr:HK97 gp10 family phage protein [Lactococcus lactis]MCT1186490.1 HK97 gp10 family phage protein [Lactococcus lactis]MCT1189564.1 HK97 gp10 family phage protein [Lactococcus lactis]MCT1195260.1 HK97 gp10 family phage protein [Lactococcus lactis]NEX49349.1 hypothetical protein [Lactococcus lactis]NEX52800.1 hypothetical protein [Lactococcus lactis]
MGKFADFDYREVQKFIERFDGGVKDELVLREIEKEFQRVTNMAINIVKKKTPVGKSISYTGLVLEGNNLYEKQMKTKGHGQLRRGWHSGEISKSGNDLMVEIYNDVEYAIYVEKGHRQQAGRYVPVLGKRLKASWVEGVGMLEKSLDPIEQLMIRVIGKAFENALSKLFED